MAFRKLKETDITMAEAYELLSKIKEPNPLQSRVLDYMRKLIKVQPSKSSELLDKLIKEFDLERYRAVQIVNVMPESIEELRVFFTGLKGKLITTTQLKKINELLSEYRIESLESS